MSNGKGSQRRGETREERLRFEKNWDSIFSKKRRRKAKKK